MNKLFLLFSLLLSVGFFSSCSENPTPKPRGYFRIDMPQRAYTSFQSSYPYRFEYPVYAKVVPQTSALDEPYWINLEFPGFRGTLHMSYKRIDGNLNSYIEDSRILVNKHIPKSSGIEETRIENKASRVFGSVFRIEGSSAASPFQFYLTDSTRHFLRAALYFNVPPNNDSLAPVIRFLEEDILHLISSLRWE